MDFNIEVRRRQLRSLAEYVKSSRDSINAMYNSLEWNPKNAWQGETKLPCSVNKNHLISLKSSENHVAICKLQSLGYYLKDTFLPDPPENSSCSIRLDSTTKVAVLTKARENSTTFKAAWNGHDLDPMTADRLTSTFSSDERLAVYDYCIKNTNGPPKPREFSLSLETEKDVPTEVTLEQQLLQERNAKRRRVKYKSVHTNRKNQTEIIREVIDNQMELYTEWLREKNVLEEEKIKEHEKNGQENPFENPDSSEQYHYIQVHTTYGDVSIPANALSEPLPSFDLEEKAYVDKPPSPQNSRRSADLKRSRDKHRRLSNDDHKNNDRSRNQGLRRSESLDRSNSPGSKNQYKHEEPHRPVRRSRSAERSFHARDKLLLSRHKPRRSKSRSFEGSVYKKKSDRELFSRRREPMSPIDYRSPLSRQASKEESISPLHKSPQRQYFEDCYHYNKRRISPERRSLLYLEQRMFDEDRKPHFSPERDWVAPETERREYDQESTVFRGRGRGLRGRFDHFRGRRRSRGRQYFRN